MFIGSVLMALHLLFSQYLAVPVEDLEICWGTVGGDSISLEMFAARKYSNRERGRDSRQ